jgi:NADH-quinone oxidoreductase subunit N
MYLLSLFYLDKYEYIYNEYIINLFEWILIMPELLYFGYLIGFLIQYLIIEKKAELKGILETILFITFAVIPTFFFMIESSKHEKILKDIWVINSHIYFIKLIVIISFLMVLILILIEEENYNYSIFKSDVILLLLLSVFGLLLTISFNDFVLMILSLELSSLSIYILCGIKKESNKSMEAAWKYFLYNSVSTLIMIFGITLIYLLFATLNYNEIILLLKTKDIINENYYIYNFAILSIIFGFLFKLVLFPFWWWLEEIYEGLSMILIFYLTIVPKIIYLYLLYKIMFVVFTINLDIINFLIVLSIITIIISGIYGLYQRKIKKLLAYSSISHMVFILIPILIDNSIFGLISSIYYFIIYIIVNILLFYVLIVLKRKYMIELNDILDFIFLKNGNKFLNISLSISLLSSAGIPPFCGFFGKVWVFNVLLLNGEYFIFFLLIIFSIVNAIYYIRLIRWIFFSNELKDEFKIVRWKISFNILLLIIIFVYLNIFFIFIQGPLFYLILNIFLIN